MKIRKEYQESIIQITNNLTDLVGQLGYIQYSMEMLKISKEQILDKIIQNNKERQSLQQKIYKQYGEGYINPETFQFISQRE